MAKRIIFRADDAGLTSGANDAIVNALAAGMVKNVGIMFVCPAALDAVEKLRPYAESCDLGIHAAVTSEWGGLRWGPLLPPESVASLLKADGAFARSVRDLQEKARPDEILREVEAQVRAAMETRVPFRYLDTHMVFTWLPEVLDGLADIARRYELILDQGHACSVPKIANLPLSLSVDAIADHLAQGNADPALAVWHPCLLDDDARQMYRETPGDSDAPHTRDAEAQLLADQAFVKALADRDIELIRYRDLGKSVV